ncbi:MAG: copper homeostasis protein CutC [Planctomycetota bacterium]
MTQRVVIEICIDSAAGIRAAEAGGADRVELCANLAEGGTTPSRGLLRQTRRVSTLPMALLVRPRSGDFVYDAFELAALEDDIRLARDEGADVIVSGALRPDGSIDRDRTARLIELARPVPFTFHRAFDLVADPRTELEVLIELGAARVLTSGQAPSAPEGVALLKELVAQADGRLIVMAGAGIRSHNVQALVEASGVREVHGSAFTTGESTMVYRNPSVGLGSVMPRGEYEIARTDEAKVRAMREALG